MGNKVIEDKIASLWAIITHVVDVKNGIRILDQGRADLFLTAYPDYEEFVAGLGIRYLVRLPSSSSSRITSMGSVPATSASGKPRIKGDAPD